MQTEAIKAAYRRYARVYDALFGPVLHPGRKLVVRALACRPGDRILEVGVGTGLSLPLYPDSVRVTGIDLSREMLERARCRVAGRKLSHVEALLDMDAEATTFPDASFDKVVAMYVVSVVRHPARMLEEMRRVCRPGGDILIVNHFLSENRVIRALEGALGGFSAQLGFHPDFGLRELLACSPLPLAEVSRINVFWRVLRFRNLAGRTEAQAEARPAVRRRARRHPSGAASPSSWSGPDGPGSRPKPIV